MKNERIILVAFLVLVCINTVTVFRYVSSLKEQNKALSDNLGQIIKRIEVLELDKTMEKITALKAENMALKKQITALRSKCPGQGDKEGTAAGNRGFLIKK
ncbi:MAG: hypothetical protein WC723_02070 [Candidatus Omnitrophota bacterium]